MKNLPQKGAASPDSYDTPPHYRRKTDMRPNTGFSVAMEAFVLVFALS